jgi:hypothetical protein
MSRNKKTGIWARYQDGWFIPFSGECTDRSLEDGKVYRIKIDEQRYWPRHEWFMAFVREAWESLPDEEHNKYRNADHFRKRMLIAAGYATVQKMPMPSEEAATMMATYLGKLTDDYSIVTTAQNVVIVMTAKSQSLGDVGKPTGMENEEEFKRSCNDVVECIARLYGITPDTIARYRNGRDR